MARRRKNKTTVPADLSQLSDILDGLDPEFRDRVLSGIESGQVSPRDVLEFLTTAPGLGIMAARGQQDSGRKLKASKSADVAPPAEIHRELQEAVQLIAGDIPDATYTKAREAHAVVTLKDSPLQEGIQASVAVKGRKAHDCALTMDREAYTVGYSCSCDKQYCIPFTCFMLAMLDQVEDFQSPLCVEIFGREAAEEMEQRRQKAAELELKRVQDRLFRSLQKAGSSSGLLSLDEQSEAAAERVIWNLVALGPDEAAGPYAAFKAIVQKEKKSGGWGKGRELGLKKFMEMSRDCWTATDRKIATHIDYERWGYNLDYSFDGICRALEGSSTLELNRSPAMLEIRQLEVVVIDIPDGGWGLSTSSLELKDQWGDDAVGLSHSEGNIVFSESKGAVVWFPVSESLRDLVEMIKTEDVRFHEDQRDVLLRDLNSLETTVPVQFPTSLVSEVRPVAVDCVLLLRMKKTGSLEATLCVRDNRKLLMHAGDGQTRRLEVVDDVPVQFVRDAVAERKAIQGLERRLEMGQFLSIRESTWLLDDPEAVIDLLQLAAEQVDQGDLVLVWHKESVKQVNIIGSLSAANVSVKVTKQRDWFNINGSCQFGDQEVLLKDVLNGLRGTSSMDGLIEVSAGQWASIADDFRATLQMLADSANDNRGKLQLDQSAAMSLAAIDEKALDIKADKAWQKCLDKVRSIESISPDPPAALDCEFRDYQLDGFRWMCRLAEWGVGGILADDMGLGKTVQTLAVLLQRTESGPALVIAPTSLGFNWESECHKFAPSLSPKLLRDGDRQKLIESATEGDVIICSYGLALRESELLQTVDWGTLVLDEAQNIKNSNTKTAKEVRKLSAGWKVALTGTPMENHLGELWSIFRAVSPGVLGSWEQFRKKFAAPIEKEDNNERRVALSRVISPFILRRTKKEVLTDLPDRLESNLLIELTKEEQERYDQVRLAAVGELEELGDDELSSDQRFKVLQLLTRLRQISCHVGLIDENWKHGSSKLRMLMERLEQLKERGHRALIFSQFTSHLGLIKEACDAAGISYQYLDGQTTPKARQQRVELFQEGEGDAFLISLKAGGTGLNLTAADYVIHMDPWWNPAVEDQATDRAHRIGQKNNVMVYRIIAKGTIEEQIISLHAEKRDLVEGVLSGSEASGKMSTEQLATLIRDGVTAKV